ncbi:hypothetical protein CASFOL_042326 [Castilleja foliolosa]|uniref:Uncharacterized protein n=1 Tax=Castilleja foliolosa TaxID=1961234 RepID=A0ABD3BBJ4_9LAMI
MRTHHLIIFLITITLQTLNSSAIKYQVINDAPNTPGGSRFNSKIGTRYTLQIMQSINFAVWNIFQQYNYSDRKNVKIIKVFIQQYKDNGDEAFTSGDNINVSASYLASYRGDDLRRDFTGLLHHEMTHVLQSLERNVPEGLIDGVAEYIKLKLSYNQKSFAKRGDGTRWDQGYDITARFLEYCDELKPGFVAELNKMMKFDYSDSYFEKLTGKSVGLLWGDYKAKYRSRG